MKKIIVMALGVIVSAAAVSTFAASKDQKNLALCKADIENYYGENARTRLRSIRQSSGEAQLRLMVRPEGGSNTMVICSVSRDGISRIENSDGVALVVEDKPQTVSLAK